MQCLLNLKQCLVTFFASTRFISFVVTKYAIYAFFKLKICEKSATLSAFCDNCDKCKKSGVPGFLATMSFLCETRLKRALPAFSLKGIQ